MYKTVYRFIKSHTLFINISPLISQNQAFGEQLSIPPFSLKYKVDIILPYFRIFFRQAYSDGESQLTVHLFTSIYYGNQVRVVFTTNHFNLASIADWLRSDDVNVPFIISTRPASRSSRRPLADTITPFPSTHLQLSGMQFVLPLLQRFFSSNQHGAIPPPCHCNLYNFGQMVICLIICLFIMCFNNVENHYSVLILFVFYFPLLCTFCSRSR